MLDEIDPILMLRYLAGECTPAERKHIAAWMDSAPSGRAEIDAYRRLTEEWRALGSEASKAPAMLERLHRMMDEDEARSASAARTTAIECATARAVLGPGADSSSVQGRHIGRAPGGKFAAAMNPETLGITPHPSFFRIGREGGTTRRTWPRGAGGDAGWRWGAGVALVVAVGISVGLGVMPHGARGIEAPGREIATAAGQRLSVTLVDGTQVALAPASRVRLAADYGRDAGVRDVELEGEAYFAVVHDVAHPFAVRAHGAVARDVGTMFDVRAYPEDVGVRVGVAEGAVAVTVTGGCPARTGAGAPGEVRAELCDAEARAGDVVTVANSEVAVEHQADVAAMTSWTAGRLTFENTGMGAVARELGRWYGVEIRIATPALEAQHITATYTNQPVDAVLRLVAHALGATVERHGRTVVVR